jgi:hypothetical protein
VFDCLHAAIYSPGKPATWQDAGGEWFRPVNSFVLLSVCSTIQAFLQSIERGPIAHSDSRGSVYGQLLATNVEEIFRQKMEWFTKNQSELRRTRLLQKVTKDAEAWLPKSYKCVVSYGGVIDTLDGLESDDEEEGVQEKEQVVQSVEKNGNRVTPASSQGCTRTPPRSSPPLIA